MKRSAPIGDIKGVGAKYREVFHKYGIYKVEDLLYHFPVYYIDFNNVSTKLELGARRLYHIEILDWALSRRYRRRFSVIRVSAKIIGDGQPVSIVFFNQHYLADYFNQNKTAYIFGQFKIEKKILQANTPALYKEEDREKRPVEPVYTGIGTIKSGKIKQLMQNIFAVLEDDREILPETIVEKHNFPPVVTALKQIHFPDKYQEEKIETLKRRFIYQEFFDFLLELQYIRNHFKQVPRHHHYKVTPQLKEQVFQQLPFELTPDQQTACDHIMEDIQGKYTMQRLLQGDVGSGKTIVAFIALQLVVAHSKQGAFLAPTEILASQHYINAQSFFKDCSIELLTGSTPAKKRKDILARLAAGEIKILFGTHALFTETVHFHDLSMVVIDEQHRFGVSQRAALYYKGNAVDLLVTTATPIPRTMLLSLYNDLNASTIKTKPKGRLPIVTKIRRPETRDEFYKKLSQEVRQGGVKAFIILPLIEPSDFFTELRDIETELPYYKKKFKGISIGVVTGRTPAAEKDRMLEQMLKGELNILIATTVIEVGIDIPDATVMVIENADRYGLSQLHQLRGRVGRGELQSYCYLFPSPTVTESGAQRLKTIAETNDGFEIAETDLKMRGGGIISGLQQSGYLDFKLADMKDHLQIFKQARQDVATLLETPEMWNPYISDNINKTKSKLKELNFS